MGRAGLPDEALPVRRGGPRPAPDEGRPSSRSGRRRFASTAVQRRAAAPMARIHRIRKASQLRPSMMEEKRLVAVRMISPKGTPDRPHLPTSVISRHLPPLFATSAASRRPVGPLLLDDRWREPACAHRVQAPAKPLRPGSPEPRLPGGGFRPDRGTLLGEPTGPRRQRLGGGW